MSSNSSILNKRHIITEIIEDAYVKLYKIRAVGAGSSLEATIPRVIVEREARKNNLSIKEFIELYRVEYLFNDFGGAFVRFRNMAEQSNATKKPDHSSETKESPTNHTAIRNCGRRHRASHI